MLHSRTFNKEKDYTLWSQWWEHHERPVPLSLVPDLGLIIDYNNVPLAAGFLAAPQGAAICMGNIAGNPNATKEHRNEALNFLIKSLLDLAKRSEYTVVCVSTNVPALKARYERLGFFVTDTNVTHYGKVL